MTATPSPVLVSLALLTVQLLFGVNYIVSKMVVGQFPPLVWASIRIIVSTILMFGIASATKHPHPIRNRQFFVPMIGLSLLGMIINQASFLVGLHYTTPTNSAILCTLIPVFALIFITIRGQEALTLNKFLGFVTAFIGVLVIRGVENLNLSDQTLLGDLLTILNCLSYGLFISVGKNFLQKHDRVWTTAWMFLYGSIGITLIALPDWMHFSPPSFNLELIAASIFAILGGTLGTYFLNMWALAHTKSSSVALYIFIQPIFTVLLTWIWKNEPPSLRSLISIGFIFAGMLIATNRIQIGKRS